MYAPPGRGKGNVVIIFYLQSTWIKESGRRLPSAFFNHRQPGLLPVQCMPGFDA